MKYLLLFFICFTLNADELSRRLVIKNRLKAIGVKFKGHGSVSGLRKFMNKCNYNHPNPAIWVREVFKIENPSYITCLESKVEELQTEKTTRDTIKSNRVNARIFIKNFTCSDAPSPIIRALCRVNK